MTRARDAVIGANASMYKLLDFRKIKRVCYPRSERDVLEAVVFARERGYDIATKGGGSGLSGACTGGNLQRVMISTLNMRKIQSLNIDGEYVDVEPGATPNEINSKLEPLEMRFCVAPASRDVATVGGMICTDAGGNDAWMNGTMRDNTVSARLVTYSGDVLTVDNKGVTSDNNELQDSLNGVGMNLQDIASSHGTLGIITQMRLRIKQIRQERTSGVLFQFDDLDAMGSGILQAIEEEQPVIYGESIVMVHEDVRDSLNPPQLIMELPEGSELELCDATANRLSREELAHFQNLRLGLARRNPKKGVQLVLFEDYGLYGNSLKNMAQTVSEIDHVLLDHHLEPFAKYGHAPSKWYIGDDSPVYGFTMHAYEIKPEDRTGPEIFQAVKSLEKKCDEIGITPKPEHKWIYSDDVKKKRLAELRGIMGDSFNSFIFEDDCASQTLSSMV